MMIFAYGKEIVELLKTAGLCTCLDHYLVARPKFLEGITMAAQLTPNLVSSFLKLRPYHCDMGTPPDNYEHLEEECSEHCKVYE